jgi:hypothetical protein
VLSILSAAFDEAEWSVSHPVRFICRVGGVQYQVKRTEGGTQPVSTSGRITYL